MLQIIAKYDKNERQESTVGHPSRSDCRVKHESKIFSLEARACCQYCRTFETHKNRTNRKCPDCQFQPALCQTVKRDCHSLWHEPQFDETRDAWFSKQIKHSDDQSIIQPVQFDQAESSDSQFLCSRFIYLAPT